MPPRLICELNLGCTWGLPAWSAGPQGLGLPWQQPPTREQSEAVYRLAKAAGYDGIQGGDAALCRELGLSASGGGRVDRPEDADNLGRILRDQGIAFAAIHVGHELMDDATCDRLCGAILEAQTRHGVPIWIELHRATITQDGFRTLRLIERHPDLRFNADLSHWYTGHEMMYGDFNARLDAYAPVFARVRCLHGRIGNSSHMQVGILDGRNQLAVGHFQEMWRRCAAGYLAADASEHRLPLSFAPELLPPAIRYAREFADGHGGYREESDRWLEALELCRLMRESYARAAAPAA